MSVWSDAYEVLKTSILWMPFAGLWTYHTQNYKEDFELDAGLLHSLAGSQSPEDKHLLWMSRPNGTYLLPEREVYVEDSYENKVWEFYHEQTP